MRRVVPFALVLLLTTTACRGTPELAKMAAMGRAQDLRPIGRAQDLRGATPAPTQPPSRPTFLLIGIDGMKRRVLYDALRDGALPGLAALLGGRSGSGFPHAYLDRSMLAGLPSITIVGWASIFTGAPPAA